MSLLQTLVVIFLISYHFNLCSSTEPRQLFQLIGEIAKSKFCRQKSFDAVSFDGKNYRFSVTRKDIASDRFIYELFLLTFNTTSDSFQYKSVTFDDDNVVPLGGFYLQQKGVYVEFFKNAKKVNEVSYCFHKCFPKEPICQTCTRMSLDAKSQFSQLILYSEAIKFLKDGRLCTFAYDPEQEKMVYIFSDRKEPIIFNSLRTFSKQVYWFTKHIDNYKMHKFVGSFNWPTKANNSSTIFLLAQSQWKRTNLTIFELSTISGKFALKQMTTPWQEFFGCYRKMGHSQRWHSLERAEKGQSKGSGHLKSTKNSSVFNRFTVTILVVFVLVIVIVFLAVVHNVKFSTVKPFCNRLFSPTNFAFVGN